MSRATVARRKAHAACGSCNIDVPLDCDDGKRPRPEGCCRGPGLSDEARAPHRSVSAGRGQRYACAHVRREVDRSVGAANRRGQSRWSGHHDRDGPRGARSAGRLHHSAFLDRHARDFPQSVQQAGLRSDQGFRAHHASCHRAHRAVPESRGARQFGERADRARQGEAGRSQVCIRRQRHACSTCRTRAAGPPSRG